MRDVVLNRDYDKIEQYFPIGGEKKGIGERWKEITKQFKKKDLIRDTPSFGQPYWENWLHLLEYRNGLVHARASRPDVSDWPEESKPKPSKDFLAKLSAGWATNVIVDLILELNKAAGIAPPKWLVRP